VVVEVDEWSVSHGISAAGLGTEERLSSLTQNNGGRHFYFSGWGGGVGRRGVRAVCKTKPICGLGVLFQWVGPDEWMHECHSKERSRSPIAHPGLPLPSGVRNLQHEANLSSSLRVEGNLRSGVWRAPG
jgi:hypothetical protein